MTQHNCTCLKNQPPLLLCETNSSLFFPAQISIHCCVWKIQSAQKGQPYFNACPPSLVSIQRQKLSSVIPFLKLKLINREEHHESLQLNSPNWFCHLKSCAIQVLSASELNLYSSPSHYSLARMHIGPSLHTKRHTHTPPKERKFFPKTTQAIGYFNIHIKILYLLRISYTY